MEPRRSRSSSYCSPCSRVNFSLMLVGAGLLRPFAPTYPVIADVARLCRAADARKARCTNITLGLAFVGLFIFLVAVRGAVACATHRPP